MGARWTETPDRRYDVRCTGACGREPGCSGCAYVHTPGWLLLAVVVLVLLVMAAALRWWS